MPEGSWSPFFGKNFHGTGNMRWIRKRFDKASNLPIDFVIMIQYNVSSERGKEELYMKEGKSPQKPFIYYCVVVVLILTVLNATVFPAMMNLSVTEVGYDTFRRMVDEKKVKRVEIGSDYIAYIAEVESMDGTPREGVFKTGLMDDPGLNDRLYEAGVIYGKVIEAESSPLISFLLSWIFPMILFMGMGSLLIRMVQKRAGGPGAMQFGKSNAKVYVEAQTGKTFADVAGQDEAKEALREIVDFLHEPERYKDIGAQLPKGALLVGPPGTGKTLLAKAVAGEAKVPFFSISGSEFVEMFVGMGAARVRDLFKQAQEKAPCIVFIDEIDAIGKSRNGSMPGGNDEREQTLNQLLTEMDGFDGSKGVVLLAATNRPESLDAALLRPGRFDRRIPVELPDLNGRAAILAVHSAKVKLASSVDLMPIARATNGASGAELANIVNEAALRAVRQGRQTVEQGDLEESVEVVIAGYQRKNAVLSERDRLTVSYHEIGHALVAALQKGASPVHKITIVPRTSGALGYTMQVDESDQVLISREQAMARITTYTGGRAAEELVFHSITTGASNDIEQATKLARAMVTRYGMSDQFGMMALSTQSNAYLGGDASLTCSETTAARIDEEVRNMIAEAYQTATELLSGHMDKLHELAKYLLERETITGEEFMEILNRK